ncbi:MAG: polysaccharide deacetylase family protein [Bacteroidales bacterium]|nr:polysaccharide deacetylase family protein [Bacteroidales bacterium]
MNLLTFDIEEWYIEQQRNSRVEKYAEYDRYLDAILNKLDERGFKATFFCVGEMGKSFPQVIRTIQKRGHEIGCHSNIHTWLNKMTEAECSEDTHRAVDSLEQCIGEKVKSYRAPAFSIGEKNKWAFEVLAKNGIERDASIFPAARDFGGFPHFGQKTPCIVVYDGVRIKEFPICTTKVLGKEMAYSGGGYFRFFPLGFVEKQMNKSTYAMCYFHIGDLIPESHGVMSKEAYEAYYKEKGTFMARYVRYLKSSTGKKTAFQRMMKLIDNMEFVGMQQADCGVDWEVAKVVKL